MKNLYHVTLRCNVNAILREGLQPKYATGARRAVYLVDAERLAWSIAHVASRHGVAPPKLSIFRVEVPPHLVKKMRYEGVFFCTEILTDVSLVVRNAMSFLIVDERANEGKRDDNHNNVAEWLANAPLRWQVP